MLEQNIVLWEVYNCVAVAGVYHIELTKQVPTT